MNPGSVKAKGIVCNVTGIFKYVSKWAGEENIIRLKKKYKIE